MSKIAFKNPKGNTLYYANIGFDWGAFWSLFIVGLPFFVRKMNNLAIFSIGFNLVGAISLVSEMNSSSYSSTVISWLIFSLAISFYLGLRGGRLAARHYLEEGYKFHTTDKNLLALAKNKWQLED